jgi:hypothetical protein
MKLAFAFALFLSICLCLGLSSLAGATSMKQIDVARYDGVYSVKITTEAGAGPCEKVYQGSVTIANGRITEISDPQASATGLIEDDGTVSLSFRENGQIAHVGGRISGRYGSGAWSSPTAECGGVWRSERQRSVAASSAQP